MMQDLSNGKEALETSWRYPGKNGEAGKLPSPLFLVWAQVRQLLVESQIFYYR